MAGDGVGSREGGKMADMDEGKGIRNRQSKEKRWAGKGRDRGEKVEGLMFNYQKQQQHLHKMNWELLKPLVE